MIATMEHYVLEYGRERAMLGRQANEATDPLQEERIDTEGLINSYAIGVLNSILAEVKRR
jgi:hypothetical protein